MHPTKKNRGASSISASRSPLIAVDARLVGYAAGIAQYTLNLLEALDRQPGPERYLALVRPRGGTALTDTDRRRRVEALTPPHHPFERWTVPLDSLRTGRWPDLLHSIDHVAPRWGVRCSVVTVHDLAFDLFPETHSAASRAYYAGTASSVRKAARVIAVSAATAADLTRLYAVDPLRIRIVQEAAAAIYSPRDEQQVQAVGTRLGVPPGRPYVLFVGTLEPRKNLVLLLEAFALARGGTDIDLHLVIVGNRGWHAEEAFAAHERLQLGAAVTFLGQTGREELAALYSGARMLVLPSLYEGFGLPVLEAMACGTPVVASDAGPLPEVGGDAAMYVPPRSAQAWADAIAHLATDAARRERMRQAGLVRAAAFSWDRAAAETLAVYREALAA